MNVFPSRWGLLFVVTVLLASAGSARAEPDSDTGREQALRQGTVQTRELLRLMDTDQSGRVSREEFLNFMAAEFDRLDHDKNGELDPAELASFMRRGRHTGGAGGK